MIFVIAGCQLGTKIEIPGKTESQLKICFQQVDLRTCLGGIFSIIDRWCCRWCHYRWRCLGQVELSCIKNTAEREPGSKLLTNISWWVCFQAPAFSSLGSFNDGLQPVR